MRILILIVLVLSTFNFMLWKDGTTIILFDEPSACSISFKNGGYVSTNGVIESKMSWEESLLQPKEILWEGKGRKVIYAPKNRSGKKNGGMNDNPYQKR